MSSSDMLPSGKEEPDVPNKAPPPVTYSCPWCGQIFNKQMGWKYHVDNNICNKAPSCKWCRQVFDSPDTERHHMKNNICGKAPFCGWCRKIFISHQVAGNHIENNVCGKIPQDMEEAELPEVASNQDIVAKPSNVISLIDDDDVPSAPSQVVPPEKPSQIKIPNTTAPPQMSVKNNDSGPQTVIPPKISSSHSVPKPGQNSGPQSQATASGQQVEIPPKISSSHSVPKPGQTSGPQVAPQIPSQATASGQQVEIPPRTSSSHSVTKPGQYSGPQTAIPLIPSQATALGPQVMISPMISSLYSVPKPGQYGGPQAAPQIPSQVTASGPQVEIPPRMSSSHSLVKPEQHSGSQVSSSEPRVSASESQVTASGPEMALSNQSEANEEDEDDDICMKCGSGADEEKLLLCDGCDNGCHLYCLKPPLSEPPRGDWFCQVCDSVKCNKCGVSRGINNHIRCHLCKLPYHMDCVRATDEQRNTKWHCPRCNIFCPYCNKWFKSMDGLKYHMKKNVCRSSANPAESRLERVEKAERVSVQRIAERAQPSVRVMPSEQVSTEQVLPSEQELYTEQSTSEQNEVRRIDAPDDFTDNQNNELDFRHWDLSTDEHNETEQNATVSHVSNQPANQPVVDVEPDADEEPAFSCHKCGREEEEQKLQPCDGCSRTFHIYCAEPPLERRIVDDDWFCNACNIAPCVACTYNHSINGSPVRCFLCRAPYHMECITSSMAEYSKTWSCGKCKSLVCKYCKKSFKSSDGLKYHKERNVCRVLMSKEIVATCPSCQKSFTTQSGYTYHTQNVCVPKRKRSSGSGKKRERPVHDADGVIIDGKRRRVSTDRLGARESDDEDSVVSDTSSTVLMVTTKKRRVRKIEDDEEDVIASDDSAEVETSRGTKRRESRSYARVVVNPKSWDSVYKGSKVQWSQHNIDGTSNRDQKCCLSAEIQASLQLRVASVQPSSLSDWLGLVYSDTKIIHDIIASFNCGMDLRETSGPDALLPPLSSYNRNHIASATSSVETTLNAVINVTPTITTSNNGANPFYCEVCDMTFMSSSAFISHEKSKIHNQLKTGNITLDYGTIATGATRQRTDFVNLSTDFVVNTCIPITSVAICPNVSPEGAAYAAVGGTHFFVDAASRALKIDEEYILGKTYSNPNLLQIWEVSKDECKLLYFIGLRSAGPTWHCKWLSLEKNPDKIIGILSVICGDGTCLVLVVPNITNTTSLGNYLVLDESQLVLWKICLDSVALTAASWDSVQLSETESTLEIMCGSLDGVIYHWDLGSLTADIHTSQCLVKSCANQFQNVRNNFIHPIDCAISTISTCPVDRSLFLVASYNGSISVWNKRQKHKPVYSKNYTSTLGWLNDAKWDPNGMGVYLTGSDSSGVYFQRFVPEIANSAEELIFHESYYACSNSIQACSYDGHTLLLSGASDGTVRFCFPSISTLIALNPTRLSGVGQLFHINDSDYKDVSAVKPGSKMQSKISCDYYNKCHNGNSMNKEVLGKRNGFTAVDMVLCQQTPLCAYGSKSGLLRIHTFEDSITQKIFTESSKN